MIRSTQLACFFDTGCRAKKVISCTPGFRLASSRVPHVGFDRTYRNQSRSVAGWSKVTNASSPPGGNSATTSFGHSSRGLLYPVSKGRARHSLVNLPSRFLARNRENARRMLRLHSHFSSNRGGMDSRGCISRIFIVIFAEKPAVLVSLVA